jgi:hypothetical protein
VDWATPFWSEVCAYAVGLGQRVDRQTRTHGGSAGQVEGSGSVDSAHKMHPGAF